MDFHNSYGIMPGVYQTLDEQKTIVVVGIKNWGSIPLRTVDPKYLYEYPSNHLSPSDDVCDYWETVGGKWVVVDKRIVSILVRDLDMTFEIEIGLSDFRSSYKLMR
jgi:hypothetical protein